MTTARLTLEPDARLQLLWNGTPTVEETAAAKAVPGAHAIEGGFEWGWWPETAQRISDVLKLPTSPIWAFNGHMPLGPQGWTWVGKDRIDAIEWRSPTEPKPHQLAFKAWRRGGGRDGLFHPAALLEAGLGLGKTLSAIEEMLELLQYRARAKILVLVRNSLITTTWGPQLDQHAAGLRYDLLTMPRSKRLVRLTESGYWRGPRVFVHSYEDLPGAVTVAGKASSMGKVLASLEWDMIVVDESAAFRTASAQRTGRLTGFQARPLTAPYRLALSGLPIIKSATDAYPILRWLGAPTGTKEQFVGRFMTMNPYTREISLGDAEGLRSLLDCYRFQVPKNAVLSIPRAWHYENVELPANGWQRGLYRKMQKELRQYDDQDLVSNRLVELLRLAQITAGFDGENYRQDNAKLQHFLRKILPELGDEQAVIWVRFRNEALGVFKALLDARKTAVAFTGAQRDYENEAAFNSFTQGHQQFFVPTLAKGALGLNLPMAATMVYLTRDFDTESYAQSLERNARLTTKHQALNVIVVEADNTIDQKITKVLGDDLHMAAELTALDVREVLGK